MPSPFPGMDPFLEHPVIFPGVHDSLITYFREALQPRLPEPYYAEIADRVWVEWGERRIGPDVKVLREQDQQAAPQQTTGEATLVSRTSIHPIVVTVPQDELREPFLEIRSGIETERLVTVIEVLSLANKSAGEKGRNLYLRKQQENLESKSHLVEIDLLRAGEHTTAVPLARAVENAGPFDYHVCVHRFDRFEDFFVYPIALADRLPEIAVPLLPGDGEVTVDLQWVFDRAYETGPYRRRVNYQTAVLVPPLTEEQASRVSHLLSKST